MDRSLTESDSFNTGPVVTGSNLNPIIQVATWLLLALISLVLSFRLLTRFFIKGSAPFILEDALIIISYALGLGESITMVIPQSSIFGKDLSEIPGRELTAGLKTGYARDILFILCIGCSKLSACTSLFALSPSRSHRWITMALSILIAVATLSGFLSTAFQCGTQGPWVDGGAPCRGQRAILEYLAIMSIVTDAGLIAVPVVIIYPLHMSLKMRLMILSFYSARLLVIIATICQLIYLPRLFSANFTLRAFPYYICMQLVQFTSISSACVIYFWPFLRSVESGLMLVNNNSMFISHYPLATLSRPDPFKTSSSGKRADSRENDRRGYIKMTRDVSTEVPGISIQGRGG